MFNLHYPTPLKFGIKAGSLALAIGLGLAGCGTDEPGDLGLGSIQFQIEGEDITYDSLTGEDGYNHVKYATIEYAYMMVKGPKLNPSHAAKRAALPKAGASQHTGVGLSGIYAVDLLKETVLGKVDSVEAGHYDVEPSLSLYVPTPGEMAAVQDFNGAKAQLPSGISFRFGGMIYPKEGNPVRYEIRENLTAKINILEYPPEAGNGDPLHVEDGKTLVAEFHPHIDHALEVICHDQKVAFDTLEVSGDTVLFTPEKNQGFYEAIVGHINRGDHWDVNVIPE